MKKVLLIAGIVIIVAGILSLLFGLLNSYAYHSALDGSPELYGRLHQRAVTFTVTGAVFVLIGACLIIFRFRL